MLNKRVFAGLVGLSLSMCAGVTSALAAEIVDYTTNAPANSIIIDTPSRRLYFVQGDGTAIRYSVAVGRPGKQWAGEAYIASKHLRPAWSPPAEIKADNPNLPDVIPSGAPNNPMGEAALVLDRGEYAIHGTNRPDSIGTFASYGCIRMHNEDVLDLFSRVKVGTMVNVIQTTARAPAKKAKPPVQVKVPAPPKPKPPQQATTKPQRTALYDAMVLNPRSAYPLPQSRPRQMSLGN